jgi:hypothetical protein
MNHFSIPNAVKAAIGLGTFVIAGLLARESALEGLDMFETKVNDRIEKNQRKLEETSQEEAK